MPLNPNEHWQCQTCLRYFPSDQGLRDHIEAFQVRTRECLVAVTSLTFYSLVRGTCSTNYRNVSLILILDYLMRKTAESLTTTVLMVWSIMMTTAANSSCVRIWDVKANQEHHLRRGKTLCDIILFVFPSLQYVRFRED